MLSKILYNAVLICFISFIDSSIIASEKIIQTVIQDMRADLLAFCNETELAIKSEILTKVKEEKASVIARTILDLQSEHIKHQIEARQAQCINDIDLELKQGIAKLYCDGEYAKLKNEISEDTMKSLEWGRISTRINSYHCTLDNERKRREKIIDRTYKARHELQKYMLHEKDNRMQMIEQEIYSQSREEAFNEAMRQESYISLDSAEVIDRIQDNQPYINAILWDRIFNWLEEESKYRGNFIAKHFKTNISKIQYNFEHNPLSQLNSIQSELCIGLYDSKFNLVKLNHLNAFN